MEVKAPLYLRILNLEVLFCFDKSYNSQGLWTDKNFVWRRMFAQNTESKTTLYLGEKLTEWWWDGSYGSKSLADEQVKNKDAEKLHGDDY